MIFQSTFSAWPSWVRPEHVVPRGSWSLPPTQLYTHEPRPPSSVWWWWCWACCCRRRCWLTVVFYHSLSLEWGGVRSGVEWSDLMTTPVQPEPGQAGNWDPARAGMRWRGASTGCPATLQSAIQSAPPSSSQANTAQHHRVTLHWLTDCSVVSQIKNRYLVVNTRWSLVWVLGSFHFLPTTHIRYVWISILWSSLSLSLPVLSGHWQPTDVLSFYHLVSLYQTLSSVPLRHLK